MIQTKFVDDFLQDSQVRAVCVLDEAVQKHDHFVELECVLRHDSHKVVKTILEEENLSTLWVPIQKLVCN